MSLAFRVASRSMERFDETEWARLVEGATELARDRRGNVTLRCTDGRMAKTFTADRWLSSGLIRPYASRFVEGARDLLMSGFPAPDVVSFGALESECRHVVVYRPVPGRTMREALAEPSADPARLAEGLGTFLASLHEDGVSFRSFHLGNVVVDDAGSFGLIDVVDVSFIPEPIEPDARAREISRFWLRYNEDRELLLPHARTLMDAYFARAENVLETARHEFLCRLPSELSTAAGLHDPP